MKHKIADIIKNNCSVKVNGEDHAPRDGLDRAAALILAAMQPERGDDNPSEWRTRVFRAAERANAKFGGWMPQQWVEIFIAGMLRLDEMAWEITANRVARDDAMNAPPSVTQKMEEAGREWASTHDPSTFADIFVAMWNAR